MRTSELRRAFAIVFSVVLVVGVCDGCESNDARPLPAVLTELLTTPSAGGARTIGDDHFEVWLCHVPDGSTVPIYGGLPLRLSLSPEGVAKAVSRRVPAYFDALSHGRYHPVFTAGGEVSLAVDEGPQTCIDQAMAGAGADTDAVLVVADAEHAADQPGGFGTVGEPCPSTEACSVAVNGRSAYVGASDFHPDWGDDPPMDLVEHEIGHSLGWVHSGTDATGSYLSGLDVMSNSAAPRDVNAARRDGPGTLAINLFLAGWLPADDVVVATSAVTVELSASQGEKGTRLLILDNGAGALYTVELLTPDGLDDHLAAAGIAVHGAHVLDGALEPMTPLVGGPPYTALLQPGAELKVGKWMLTVSANWKVSARA